MSLKKSRWKPKPNDIRVKPKSKVAIHKLATLVRNCFCCTIPINIEQLLNQLAEQGLLEYEVLSDNQLQGSYAVTNGHFISFSTSTIEALGDPNHHLHKRHRFTVAHEIGHALQHSYLTPMGLARRKPPSKPYESAEWQADTLAGYLLIPNEIIKDCGFDAVQIAICCNVSLQAAEVAVRKFKDF